MKRLTVLILLMLIPAVLLSGCSKPNKALSAAELLDLGDKYLLEMDYEQALVKFLEAIEVEPKNPRGYLGAAEAYAALGQTDKAIEILQKGLDAIPDNAELQRMLNELEQSAAGDGANPEDESTPESNALEGEKGSPRSQEITASGVIFENFEVDEYVAKLEDYRARYENRDENVTVAITIYGVRFDEPVTVSLNNGSVVTLSEANLGCHPEMRNDLPSLLKGLKMTGFIVYTGEEEFSGPMKEEDGRLWYNYNPNGSYLFVLESYSFIND